MIDIENSWESISDEQYNQFSDALSMNNLFYFMDDFQGNLPNKVILNLAINKSGILLEWLDLMLPTPHNNYRESNFSEEFKKVFNLLADNIGLDEVIRILFNTSYNDDTVMITAFSSLGREIREQILRHVLKNREEGIRALSEWIVEELCEHPLVPDRKPGEKPYRGDKFLPFLRAAFGMVKLKPLLEEIDPNLPAYLKEILYKRSTVTQFEDNRACVDSLFSL